MKQINATEIQKLGIENVGLDSSVLDLQSPEAINALLRRAAGFHCPCPPATLVNVVLDTLSAIVDKDDLRAPVNAALESSISYGDLIEAEEVRSDRDQAVRLLYAAPPAFVAYQDLVFLVGISADQVSVLPHDLEARIEYAAHIRRLRAAGNEDLLTDLTSLGLVRISLNSWLKTPTLMGAQDFLARFDVKLNQAGPSGFHFRVAHPRLRAARGLLPGPLEGTKIRDRAFCWPSSKSVRSRSLGVCPAGKRYSAKASRSPPIRVALAGMR